MHATTCREQILITVQHVITVKNQNEFSISEILHYLKELNSPYIESTIRTHITSRMCGNAPQHHAVTYNDLTCIKQGI